MAEKSKVQPPSSTLSEIINSFRNRERNDRGQEKTETNRPTPLKTEDEKAESSGSNEASKIKLTSTKDDENASTDNDGRSPSSGAHSSADTLAGDNQQLEDHPISPRYDIPPQVLKSPPLYIFKRTFPHVPIVVKEDNTTREHDERFQAQCRIAGVVYTAKSATKKEAARKMAAEILEKVCGVVFGDVVANNQLRKR